MCSAGDWVSSGMYEIVGVACRIVGVVSRIVGVASRIVMSINQFTGVCVLPLQVCCCYVWGWSQRLWGECVSVCVGSGLSM